LFSFIMLSIWNSWKNSLSIYVNYLTLPLVKIQFEDSYWNKKHSVNVHIKIRKSIMRSREVLSGVKWICDYLEIPNYLLLRLTGKMKGENKYDNEENFWCDILGNAYSSNRLHKVRLFEGDVVVLKSFQLSPWASRMPGLYWTEEGFFLRQEARMHLKHELGLNLHYEPYGKGLMINGGLGIIRLDVHEEYQLFGATSSGNIDASIPILCSKKVGSNLISSFKKYPIMEVDLRGIIKRIPFTYNFYARNVPRYCIYVDSTLNVNKYISDFDIKGNAWTIYCVPKARPEKRCGYTFARFNPIDEASIIEATDWIFNFIDFYTKGKGYPISDFDEIVPRFKKAVVPIRNLLNNEIDYSKLNKVHKGVDFRYQMPTI